MVVDVVVVVVDVVVVVVEVVVVVVDVVVVVVDVVVVVVEAVVVVVEDVVEGILLAQHPSSDLHSIEFTQPPFSAQNRVPSGLQA